MPDISITIEDGERHGRYVGRVAGIDAEAEIKRDRTDLRE